MDVTPTMSAPGMASKTSSSAPTSGAVAEGATFASLLDEVAAEGEAGKPAPGVSSVASEVVAVVASEVVAVVASEVVAVVASEGLVAVPTPPQIGVKADDKPASPDVDPEPEEVVCLEGWCALLAQRPAPASPSSGTAKQSADIVKSAPTTTPKLGLHSVAASALPLVDALSTLARRRGRRGPDRESRGAAPPAVASETQPAAQGAGFLTSAVAIELPPAPPVTPAAPVDPAVAQPVATDAPDAPTPVEPEGLVDGDQVTLSRGALAEAQAKSTMATVTPSAAQDTPSTGGPATPTVSIPMASLTTEGARRGSRVVAAPKKAATRGAAPVRVDPAAVLRQVSNGLRLQLDGARRSTEIELHPSELGRINVRIQMEGAEARVWLRAEHSRVSEALTAGLEMLRSELLAQGVQLVSVEIQAPEKEGRRGGRRRRSEDEAQEEMAEDEQEASVTGVVRLNVKA